MKSHIDIARDIMLKSKQKKAEDDQSSSAEIKTSAKLRSPDDIARDIWLQHNQINANPVSKWVNKFNQTMNGISDYTTKLNGGYTTDASGGFGNAVAELLQEYEGIKDTAANYGFTDAAKYVKQLQDLQGNIKSANEWYARFTPNEEQAAAGYTAEDIFAEWSKDNTFRQKYQGKSYEEIQRAIYITPKDSEEHKWLTDYAPTIMTAEDYDTEIKNSDAQIVNLEAVLEEYDRLAKQVSTADQDSYANVRLAEIRKQYGSKADIEGQLSAAKASKWQLENDQKYKLLSGNDDFDEQSKATSTEQTSNYIDYVLKNDKWKYDIINGLISSSAKSNYENGNPIMGGIWSELESNVSYMMDEEKKIFNYLYNTQGANSAEEYLDSLENTLSERAGKYTQDEWRKLAHKHPVSSSVVSVATNLYGGLGYIDAAAQKVVNSIKEAITGEYAGPVNYNSAAMMPSKVTTAIRGQVAQDLVDEHGVIEMKEEEHPVLSKILNGKSWADVYQLGMSMVDSAAVAGLSTVVGPNATLLLSGSAATQTMLDSVANGATDGQALAMGAAAGAFEYIFEKYELEHLLGADTNVVKAIFNQALTEAVGEGATSIANFAADTFIMAKNSDLQRRVREYVEKNPGMTEGKAMKQALLDKVIEVGWDAVGGFLSGGIMGGGSSVIKNLSGKLQQAKTDAQGLQTPHQSPTATAGSGGMPATGRHGDFDSLRDAPPQGEAFKGTDPSTGVRNDTYEMIRQDWEDNERAYMQGAITQEEHATAKAQINQRYEVWQQAENLRRNTAPEVNAQEQVAAQDPTVTGQQVKPTQVEAPQNETYEAIMQDWEDNERAYMQGAITQEEHASTKAQIEQRREAWRQAENLKNNAPVVNTQEQVEDISQMRSYAEQLFAEGQITEEEFDGMMELVEHYEEENYGGVREQAAQDLPVTAQADTYNGGISDVNNGTQYTAQSAAYQGDRVPDGSGQRNDGTGTGKQVGGLASLTEGGRSSWADQRTTAARRKVNGANLPQVSSRSLGLNRGTDSATLRIVPQTTWDSEEQRTAMRIQEETGLQVSYVLGDIWVQGSNNKIKKVRGVITGDQIIIRADDKKATIDQIADHEIYHYKSRTTPGMTWNIENYIRGKFTEEQWYKILQEYVKAYDGIIDVSEDGDVQMDEEAVRLLAEEIFADAYAGINNFGAGVFTEDVNQWMDDHGVGKQSRIENGTKEATGPPAIEKSMIDGIDAERYSYSTEELELRGDPKNKPTTSREWHAFNRSFANKTMNMKPGEMRNVLIYTTDYVYWVSADGYMQGFAEKKIRITERNRLRISEMEEYANEPNSNGEGFDRWSESVRSRQGRTNRSDAVPRNRRTTKPPDRLYAGKQGSNQSGYSDEDEGDSWLLEDELPGPGAMVYDGNGNSYRVGEDGRLVWLEDSEDQYSADPDDLVEDTVQEAAHEGSAAEQDDTSTDEGEKSGIRTTLPAKARSYLKGVENKLLSKLCETLSVPKFAGRTYLQDIVADISEEYLRTGTISEESASFLFDKAYAQGIVVDSEFYDAYKHIKDHMRITAVTISKQDRSNIADFDDFRKRANRNHVLRIVEDGGLPVDTAYDELHSMAPELFPEDITHPADQLTRMYDVAASIQKTERNLNEYYGSEAETFRRWARNDFEAAIDDAAAGLRDVKRYADEKAVSDENAILETWKEAMAAYEQLKKARWENQKVYAKNLLTEHDDALVGDLLRGKITLENLDPETDNVKGITAVFEAKQEYERISKLLAAYKKNLKAKLRERADSFLATANEWKDKKLGLAYSRETMERNVEDIVQDPKVAKDINREYFEPIRDAEAESMRFKDEYRDRVRALEISTKVTKGNLVSEAHAVQLLGETQDNIRVLELSRGRLKHRDGKSLSEWRAVVDKLWEENPHLDAMKIENAVKEFRKIYDELFQKMNEVRVRNGYEPVNYRQGYFPHFQPGDGDGILAQFGKAMGIDTQVVALPTTINGLTHTFKPGIQWFGNAQERLGFNTAYDAVKGFDKYIEGVSSVIHHTENIQKLRSLASQIRYRTSDEGIRKQVDQVYEDPRLTEEEKQGKVEEIYKHGKFTLSRFVVELDDYTNLLANKKSSRDRWAEHDAGRWLYAFLKGLERLVGANMIVGNLSSALTNFIPITQAAARVDKRSLVRGMWNTLMSIREDDGIIGKSSFLTNRRGSDPIVKTWVQKTSGFISKVTLMELIDGFTTGTVVRAAYYQNLKRGLSDAEAMHQADIFAARVIAERSKGGMPTIFAASNPFTKAFTQFQLEVNNQYSEIFKDIPREYRGKSALALTLCLLQYFIGALMFNDLFEKLFGRRPALDPLGMLNETVGDLTGYELPNLFDWDEGFETEKVGTGEAGKNLATNVLGELPFSSGLTLLGIETDGGRIPAASAVPNFPALWDAATKEGWSAEKRWKEVKDELNKIAYVVSPFGAGGQISKTWKGIKAYFAGGSYTVDDLGNDILQYPVYKDDPEDAFWNLVRTMIMGKNSLPEAQEWVDSGFDSLNDKQTAVYQDLLAADVNDRQAYSLLRELKSVKKTETETENQIKRRILRGSDISGEGKAIVFYGLLASDSDRELMDKLDDMGAEAGEVAETLLDMKDAESLKGKEKTHAKWDAINQAKLTDEEKIELLGSIMDTAMTTEKGEPTEYAKFLTATDRGVSVSQYIELRKHEGDIDKYLEFTDAGVGSDDALELTQEIAELEPEEGKQKVSNSQKWRIAIDSVDGVENQLEALSVFMTDTQYEKIRIAYDNDIEPSIYVKLYEMLPKYDANGNGKYTNAEVADAIDAMCGTPYQQLQAAFSGDGSAYNLTNVQKAVLWQLVTGNESAKNNPYSVAAGQKVVKARAGADDDDSSSGGSWSISDEIAKQWAGS